MDRLTTIKAAVSAAAAALTAFWGWAGWLAAAWFLAMLLDYATGSAAALHAGTWSSRCAREGLWHKAGSVAGVLVAALLDFALRALLGSVPGLGAHYDVLLCPLVTAWYLLTELGSVVENALGKAAALTGGQASTAAVAASQQAGGYYRAMLAGKLPELAQLAYERYSGEHKTRLNAIDRMLDAADSRDGVTKAQIAALLDMDDAAYDRADSKLQQQTRDAADAKAAADKKAKAEQTAAEKEKAAQEKAAKAARSDARRQIALILRNGGTVPGDLWQQSGYSAVTIAAMLRGRKG